MGLHGLIQYPAHTINNELKILRSVKPAEPVAVAIFDISCGFWDWV